MKMYFDFDLELNGATIVEQIEAEAEFTFAGFYDVECIRLIGFRADLKTTIYPTDRDVLAQALWRAAVAALDGKYKGEVDELRAQFFHNPDRPSQSYADEHRLRLREVV